MKIIRVIVSFVCLLVSLGADAQSSAAGNTLRFTAIPDQNTTELTEKFQPFADYLGKQLSMKVEYVPARDYQATVEMFRNGDVQLAWFGGLTGVQARKAVPGARAIAQGKEDPQYYSYFVAHKDTGLTESESFPQAIASMTFTFGSESSTSGRLMPEFFIREHTGKGPMEFFQHPVGFSGSHDKTAELVESGRFQVGVLNYKVFDRRVAEGKTDPKVVRIIWRTPTYADYNWTVHPSADELFGTGFIDKLQKALVSIADPALLTALPRNRLIPATNEEYEGLRAVAEALGMVR
ncbi:MAG: putative selenate ABC transporter substrate-binding protein [Gammaproteobacteria bacterium RIFCSPLOWO2_02_FULL_56_15]|nr:MAG: putative selenate ABC transporter substrate-binding protein [Gammaproteobacteria bacterium RIFCSPLOWO2_02_FULL_56_15]